MNKKIITCLLAILPFSLVACQGGGSNHSNNNGTSQSQSDAESVVNQILDGLSLNSSYTTNFNLTITGMGGATISWTSSNEEVVKIEGSQAVVTRSKENDVVVTLTASVTYNGVTKTKTFTVNIPKVEVGDYLTIAEAKELEVSQEKYNFRGVVTGFQYDKNLSRAGFYITDETGSIYVFGRDTAAAVEKGDDIYFSAERAEYWGSPQLAWVSDVEILSEGNDYSTDSFITNMTFEQVVDEANDKTKGPFEIIKTGTSTGTTDNNISILSNVYVCEATIVYYTGGHGGWELTPPNETYPYLNCPWSTKGNNPDYDNWLTEYDGQVMDVAFIASSYSSSGYLNIDILDIYPDGFNA